MYNEPNILTDLKRLERVLVSHAEFSLSIMTKGMFTKLKGSIYNVPTDLADTTNILLLGSDSNGLKVVKLKIKLDYQGHVYLEAVRLETFTCFIVSAAK